jgi:hypothetical protein
MRAALHEGKPNMKLMMFNIKKIYQVQRRLLSIDQNIKLFACAPPSTGEGVGAPPAPPRARARARNGARACARARPLERGSTWGGGPLKGTLPPTKAKSNGLPRGDGSMSAMSPGGRVVAGVPATTSAGTPVVGRARARARTAFQPDD